VKKRAAAAAKLSGRSNSFHESGLGGTGETLIQQLKGAGLFRFNRGKLPQARPFAIDRRSLRFASGGIRS